MPPSLPRPALDDLRARIARIGPVGQRATGVLPFGVPDIDRRFPEGGLPLSGLHEVAGGGPGTLHAAAAALFVAGVMARSAGHVIWCLTRPDLFAPALAQAGLDADRVIYVEAEREAALLTCFEDSLRHGGLGGVVAEVAKLSMVASRRLQLAAEASGTPGFALRRWRWHADATDFGHPTAALTRWRISALPSTPLEGAGIGRARWLVELIRQRNGGSADFIVEACDATGRLGLSSNMAGRPAVATPRDKQASA